MNECSFNFNVNVSEFDLNEADLLQLLAVSLNKIDENLITEHISEMFDN
jgi:hypothetical protein